MRNKPVAMCTRCGAISFDLRESNSKSSEIVNNIQCEGIMRAMVNYDDWTLCPTCDGEGKVGMDMCRECRLVGWIPKKKAG